MNMAAQMVQHITASPMLLSLPVVVLAALTVRSQILCTQSLKSARKPVDE